MCTNVCVLIPCAALWTFTESYMVGLIPQGTQLMHTTETNYQSCDVVSFHKTARLQQLSLLTIDDVLN